VPVNVSVAPLLENFIVMAPSEYLQVPFDEPSLLMSWASPPDASTLSVIGLLLPSSCLNRALQLASFASCWASLGMSTLVMTKAPE